MSTIAQRLEAVRHRIADAEHQFHRPPGSVRLLAVSKTWPAGAVKEAVAAGQRCFGENYLQDALTKIELLGDEGLEWHFIGPLQSNKTRPVANAFQWVHTVDRIKIARRLDRQRAPQLPPLNVCIQCNVSGEASKAGIALGDIPELAARVAELPRLRLRGLMAIPAPALGLEAQRRPLRMLKDAFDGLNREGLELDTLSMGMSADMEAAIAEGATLVRVGTAIFGPRGSKKAGKPSTLSA